MAVGFFYFSEVLIVLRRPRHMLIETVDYAQSDRGSIATLNLVDPRAYGGEGSVGSGNKSGPDWKIGDEEDDL